MIQIPIITKIILISAIFLNAPYQEINCQDYVETVLAQAVSINPQDPSEVEKNKLAIQYSHPPEDYFTRNHFPVSDWIPNNIQKNYIYYSDLNTASISREEDKVAWCESQKKVSIKSCQQKFKKTKAEVRYVPIKNLAKLSPQIPDGSILFIVNPKKYTLVSHMGFAIQKNNILYLRSASSYAGKVRDYILLDYLRFEPKALGISVLLPQEQRQEPEES